MRAFAAKNGFAFKTVSRLAGEVASGVFEGKQVILLLPSTFMNLSGSSIRKSLDYYKIPFEKKGTFLVVVDEVYLKFGTLRLRDAGSAGGHNGLKSIEEHLKTQCYARLRMGIGPEKNEDFPDRKNLPLEEFVLAPYTEAETKDLPAFIEKGVEALESWLKKE